MKTRELTIKMAALSRLQLTEAEVRLFSEQLGGVLSYVELLSEVDVRGVDPLLHPFQDSVEATPLREDVVRPSAKGQAGGPKVLESAPEVLEGGYKVPPIL